MKSKIEMHRSTARHAAALLASAALVLALQACAQGSAPYPYPNAYPSPYPNSGAYPADGPPPHAYPDHAGALAGRGLKIVGPMVGFSNSTGRYTGVCVAGPNASSLNEQIAASWGWYIASTQCPPGQGAVITNMVPATASPAAGGM